MIQFKKLKFYSPMSRATVAYTAEVSWEGRPLGSIRNDGSGGMSHLVPARNASTADFSAASAHARTQSRDLGEGYAPYIYEHLEDYIDDCAIEADRKTRVVNWIKRNTKSSLVVVRRDRAFTMAALVAAVGLKESIRRARAMDGCVVINDMPVDEAASILLGCRGF